MRLYTARNNVVNADCGKDGNQVVSALYSFLAQTHFKGKLHPKPNLSMFVLGRALYPGAWGVTGGG